MKKKLSIAFAFSFSIYAFSQNLTITKRDYSNSSNYIHTLQKLNSSNGTVLNSTNFTTNFPSNSSPKSLTFNPQTNEIFGISDNIITKNNIINSDETSFILPTATATDYGGIIIANNRLFVTKRDYSNSPIYIHSIQEINQSNGNIISSYNLTSSIPSSYNRDLSYSSLTNEIYGMSGNIIYKYNITTGSEATLTLPVVASSDYTDIIIAENRLFVVKRDYSVNPTIHTLLELNTNDASVINSHIYTTSLTNYDKIKSLTFLADTHEICGIIKNQVTSTNYKVVKYNFINNTENSFDLISPTSNDFGEIISTVSEQQNLSITGFNQNNDSKIVKAFNLLGQEIPVETYNQVIIVKFENGESKKIVKLRK
ncbi:hypothetical protein ABGT15_10750 [Flavobacterium enshiense]|uniref:hypothetical protein n=1 Tax=Flavobacterium enshiense TaxID=1341165 RepID=UPI00345CC02A